MIRVHIAHILLFVATLCGVGCTSSSEALATIDRVLESAEAEPEAALELIRSVNRERLRGDYDRARYALAYSEALYYNRICCDRDTLVTPMMRYYIHDNEHHDERARALYQHALEKFNNWEFAEALFAIEESHKSLDISENYKLRGLLHRTAGDIYQNGHLYSNACDAYSLSADYFDEAGLEHHAAHSRMAAGYMLSQIGDYAKAEELLTATKDKAIELNDSSLLCNTIYALCRVYLQTTEYSKCAATVELLNTYDCAIHYPADFNTIKAIIAAYNGDYPLAEQYLSAAESLQTTYDKLIPYGHYMVSIFKQDYKKALDIYGEMINVQNKVVHDALKLPILNSQMDYLRSSIAQEQRENELIKHRNTIIYMVITILIISVSLYLYIYNRYKAREQRRTIATYIDTINELQEKSTTPPSNEYKEAYALYNTYFTDLNGLCETLYSHGATSRESTKVVSSVNAMIDNIRNDSERMYKIEQIVNLNNDNIITRLRESGKLNDRDIRFVIYTIIGFSSATISILLNIDVDAVWRLKYKIKQKIANAGMSDDVNIFKR